MKKNILSQAIVLTCLISFTSLADARSILYTDDMLNPSVKQNNPVVSNHKSTDKVVIDSNSSKDKKELKKINKKLKKDVKKSKDTYKIDNKVVSKKHFDKKKYKKKANNTNTSKKEVKVDKPVANIPGENFWKRPAYEVIDGKIYSNGVQLQDNYKEISIFGAPIATKAQAVAFLKANNPDPKLSCSEEEIVEIYWREAAIEGIRPDLAFCQAIVETGFFTYRGDVLGTQNNFCGLGATGGGVRGASFKTPELGARAHIQHLLAYSGAASPRTEIVDPRYKCAHSIRMQKGLIDRWSGLNGTWAMGGSYSEKIFAVHQRMLAMTVDEKVEVEPQKVDDKNHKVRERIEKILHDKK